MNLSIPGNGESLASRTRGSFKPARGTSETVAGLVSWCWRSMLFAEEASVVEGASEEVDGLLLTLA